MWLYLCVMTRTKERKGEKKTIQSLFEQKCFTLDWFVKFLLFFLVVAFPNRTFLTRSRGEWGWKKFDVEKRERKENSTSSDWKSSMNFSESKETSFVLFLYLRSTENSLIKLILFFLFLLLLVVFFRSSDASWKIVGVYESVLAIKSKREEQHQLPTNFSSFALKTIRIKVFFSFFLQRFFFLHFLIWQKFDEISLKNYIEEKTKF